MGVVLWGHRSGDHGSEDWVRGLCKLLKQKPDVQSIQPERDLGYGLAQLGGLFQDPEISSCRIDARPEDVRPLRRRGIRTVLWCYGGTSSAETTFKQLRRYDAVVATESRTHRRLLRAGLGDKLYLGPEPAFLVEPVCRPMPPNTLALSLSHPWEAPPSLFESYLGLIAWILRETDWTVALIPYCVTPHCNDVLLSSALSRFFRDSGRVLVRGDASGPVLRGDISQCLGCVGFAGAVAAWSCGVPALCLRKTDRSLGLSRDLFGSGGEAVWDYRRAESADVLIRRFRSFWQREECHRNQLEQKIYRMRHPQEASLTECLLL